MKKIICLSLCAILAGCATGYGKMSIWNEGGYADTQLTKDTFLVSFRGNDMTAPERTRDLAMLRSAEIMLENGYPYFVLLDMNTSSNSSSFTMPTANATTVSYAGYTSTNYQLPMTINTRVHNSELKVRGFVQQNAPHDALEAKKVIDNIKAKYKIK